jgi:hypothetical protein
MKRALGGALVLLALLWAYPVVGYLEGWWDESWQVERLSARVGQLEADSAARGDSVDTLTVRVGRLLDSLTTWSRAYEAMRRHRDVLSGVKVTPRPRSRERLP